MNEKQTIIAKAAGRLAAQGHEATATLQFAREDGVTDPEPAVFYHFNYKQTLYSTSLEDAISVYINRIDAVESSAVKAFERLEALIRIYFSAEAEELSSMRILVQTCLVRLADPGSTCSTVYRNARKRLKAGIKNIIEEGKRSGEFHPADIDATITSTCRPPAGNLKGRRLEFNFH